MRCLFFLFLFLSLPLLSRGERGMQWKPAALNGWRLETEQQREDPWLAMDKFLHLAASASITGLSYHVYHCQYHNAVDPSICFSLSIATASGVGKELYDVKIRRTGWSWKDIAADGIGIALGYLLFIHPAK